MKNRSVRVRHDFENGQGPTIEICPSDTTEQNVLGVTTREESRLHLGIDKKSCGESGRAYRL
jgi:hypothetical protein